MLDRNEKNSDILWCGVCLVILCPYFWKLINQYWNFSFVDFPSFYFGTKIALIERLSPYDHQLLLSKSTPKIGHIFPYVYPPFSILLFSPLLFFNYESASKLILLFNFACPLLISWIIARKNIAYSVPGLFYFSFFLLTVSNPTNITILSGQINFIILIFLLVYWYGLRDNRHSWKTACSLALSIGFKTYPIVFLLNALLLKRLRVISLTILILLLLCIASYLLLPAGTWGYWANVILPSGGYGKVPPNLFSPDSPYNQSLNGFWYRMSQSLETGKYLTYISVGLALGIIFWVTKSSNEKPCNIDLNFALILLFLQIAAPYSWEHHMVMSVVGIIIGLNYAVLNKSTLAAGILILAAAVIAMEYPFDNPWLQTRRLVGLLIYLKLYSVIAAFLAIAWLRSTIRLNAS